jgi:hypothetical protein
LKALIRPKRGSSGAWGTASAGKLVAARGDMWLVMLRILEREVLREEEEEDEESDGMMGEAKKKGNRAARNVT